MVLRVRQLPIPPAFCTGDYEGDTVFRGTVHRWLADIWEFKDAEIEKIMQRR